jgi:hypothetical protein
MSSSTQSSSWHPASSQRAFKDPHKDLDVYLKNRIGKPIRRNLELVPPWQDHTRFGMIDYVSDAPIIAKNGDEVLVDIGGFTNDENLLALVLQREWLVQQYKFEPHKMGRIMEYIEGSCNVYTDWFGTWHKNVSRNEHVGASENCKLCFFVVVRRRLMWASTSRYSQCHYM